MNKKIKAAKKIINIAKEIINFKENEKYKKETNNNLNVEKQFNIDKVIIKIVSWNSRTAMGTINVMQGGQPHFSLARIKNLLDRNKPNFDYNGKNAEEISKLKQDVVDCFGGEQQLIEKLKNLEQEGIFYAQVDNFKPYCDAYHLTNEQGIEIYVKFTIIQKPRMKADFIVLVRCHTDTIKNKSGENK